MSSISSASYVAFHFGVELQRNADGDTLSTSLSEWVSEWVEWVGEWVSKRVSWAELSWAELSWAELSGSGLEWSGVWMWVSDAQANLSLGAHSCRGSNDLIHSSRHCRSHQSLILHTSFATFTMTASSPTHWNSLPDSLISSAEDANSCRGFCLQNWELGTNFLDHIP